MSDGSNQNLYHLMLGLPEETTSPNHYQLLGLEFFEDDEKLIRDAAVARNSELLKWQNSKFHEEADWLMDEVVAARDMLLDPVQQGNYDRLLHRRLKAQKHVESPGPAMSRDAREPAAEIAPTPIPAEPERAPISAEPEPTPSVAEPEETPPKQHRTRINPLKSLGTAVTLPFRWVIGGTWAVVLLCRDGIRGAARLLGQALNGFAGAMRWSGQKTAAGAVACAAVTRRACRQIGVWLGQLGRSSGHAMRWSGRKTAAGVVACAAATQRACRQISVWLGQLGRSSGHAMRWSGQKTAAGTVACAAATRRACRQIGVWLGHLGRSSGHTMRWLGRKTEVGLAAGRESAHQSAQRVGKALDVAVPATGRYCDAAASRAAAYATSSSRILAPRAKSLMQRISEAVGAHVRLVSWNVQTLRVQETNRTAAVHLVVGVTLQVALIWLLYSEASNQESVIGDYSLAKECLGLMLTPVFSILHLGVALWICRLCGGDGHWTAAALRREVSYTGIGMAYCAMIEASVLLFETDLSAFIIILGAALYVYLDCILFMRFLLSVTGVPEAQLRLAFGRGVLALAIAAIGFGGIVGTCGAVWRTLA